MSFKKNICVISGSRADYGIMSKLLRKMQLSKNIDLKLIVTCMHLIPKYGNTYKEILKDKIKIYKKIPIPLESDKIKNISKATGVGIIKYTEILSNIKPDLVLILGDRFEGLAFAVASLFLKIPIAHIHGGESTYASIDDAIRHSITKMSNYHFVSNKFYKNRLKRMGEDPKKIFDIGSLGVENLKTINFFKKKEIEKKLNTKLFKNNLLITFHPETIGNGKLIKNIESFLNHLKKIKDTKLIFTAPNVDMGSNHIFKKINIFVKLNPKNTIFVRSLGQKLYFSLIKYCNLVVGNSSSGIIEIPSFGKPSINIGNRQLGRIKAKSVIDCKINLKDFKFALKKGLSKSFNKKIKKIKNPYYKKNTSEQLITILKKLKLNNVTGKKFYGK